MRHTRTVAALTVVGLAAGGTSFAASQGDKPLDDLTVLREGTPIELSSSDRRSLNSEVVADYGLNLSDARLASDDTADSGGRGVPSSLQGTWIVIPGTEGVCLVPGDNSLTCAPISAVEDAQFAMTTLPIPDEPYVPGKAPAVGSGPGKVQGMVPDRITRVVGLDKTGHEIASTSVVNNVYELDITTFRDLGDVRLLAADGSATTLPLGPNR